MGTAPINSSVHSHFANIQLHSGGLPISALFKYPAERDLQRRYGCNPPKLLVLGLASTFGTPLAGREVGFHKIIQLFAWTHHWVISVIKTSQKNHPATDLSWSQLSGIPREEIFLAGKLSTGCPACRSAVPWASKQNADRLNGDHVSLHVTFTVHTHTYIYVCYVFHMTHYVYMCYITCYMCNV